MKYSIEKQQLKRKRWDVTHWTRMDWAAVAIILLPFLLGLFFTLTN